LIAPASGIGSHRLRFSLKDEFHPHCPVKTDASVLMSLTRSNYPAAKLGLLRGGVAGKYKARFRGLYIWRINKM